VSIVLLYQKLIIIYSPRLATRTLLIGLYSTSVPKHLVAIFHICNTVLCLFNARWARVECILPIVTYVYLGFTILSLLKITFVIFIRNDYKKQQTSTVYLRKMDYIFIFFNCLYYPINFRYYYLIYLHETILLYNKHMQH